MTKINNTTASKILGYGINEDQTWCQLVFEMEDKSQLRVEFPAKQLINIAPNLHHVSLSIYQHEISKNGTNPGNVEQTFLIQPEKVSVSHTPLTSPPAVTLQIQQKIASVGYIFSQEQAEWMAEELNKAVVQCKNIDKLSPN